MAPLRAVQADGWVHALAEVATGAGLIAGTGSTPAVMSATRTPARAHGIRIREFETLWDVDLPDRFDRFDRLDGLLARAAR